MQTVAALHGRLPACTVKRQKNGRYTPLIPRPIPCPPRSNSPAVCARPFEGACEAQSVNTAETRCNRLYHVHASALGSLPRDATTDTPGACLSLRCRYSQTVVRDACVHADALDSFRSDGSTATCAWSLPQKIDLIRRTFGVFFKNMFTFFFLKILLPYPNSMPGQTRTPFSHPHPHPISIRGRMKNNVEDACGEGDTKLYEVQQRTKLHTDVRPNLQGFAFLPDSEQHLFGAQKNTVFYIAMYLTQDF